MRRSLISMQAATVHGSLLLSMSAMVLYRGCKGGGGCYEGGCWEEVLDKLVCGEKVFLGMVCEKYVLV